MWSEKLNNTLVDLNLINSLIRFLIVGNRGNSGGDYPSDPSRQLKTSC